MKAVGHLVRVGADERPADPVYGPVERIQGYGAQLAGKGLLEFGVKMLPEGAAAGDDVLPRSGLGFVKGSTCPLGQRCPFQGRVHALFVQCMTGFVGGGEEAIPEIVLLYPRGDPHVS